MKVSCNKHLTTQPTRSNSPGCLACKNINVEALSGRTINHRPTWIVVVLSLAVLFFSRSAGATNGGSISGTVTDRSGAVVANAIVIVRDVDRGVGRSTSTNDAGFYAFTFLPVGQYGVEIQSPGFRPYARTGLVIDIGSALQVDAALEVGEHEREPAPLALRIGAKVCLDGEEDAEQPHQGVDVAWPRLSDLRLHVVEVRRGHSAPLFPLQA